MYRYRTMAQKNFFAARSFYVLTAPPKAPIFRGFFDKISIVLVIDSIRKKVLALSNHDTIAFDINMVDIVPVVCPDAAKIKEERHRSQIVTKMETFMTFI